MNNTKITDTKINVKRLLEKLGYSFEDTHPPCYSLALALEKTGFDEIRITQIVTLNYPIQINF